MPTLITPILDAQQAYQIQRAGELIRQGGLVAFPTETVYGLGALGLNKVSVAKIFAAKERPLHNPLILHVETKEQAALLFNFDACENPDTTKALFEKFTNAFWPGPLTLVAFKKDVIPSIVTAGSKKVAVRVPSHPVALALLRSVQAPVAAPSANASSRPSATAAAHVQYTLDGKIDAILDGGPCAHGLESTVIDISQSPPQLLRMGAISLETILSIEPKTTWRPIGLSSHEALGSPGLVCKHYAPKIEKIELIASCKIDLFWLSKASILLRQSSKNALKSRLGPRPESALTFILPDDPFAYAQQLFAALYDLEQSKTRWLIIEKISIDDNTQDLSLSILDRLTRAVLI
jgi:L-threonylcarbamoyladenylate synthase